MNQRKKRVRATQIRTPTYHNKRLLLASEMLGILWFVKGERQVGGGGTNLFIDGLVLVGKLLIKLCDGSVVLELDLQALALQLLEGKQAALDLLWQRLHQA